MWLGMQMSGCHPPLRMVDGNLGKWAEAGGESVRHVIFPPGCRQKAEMSVPFLLPKCFFCRKICGQTTSLPVPSRVTDCVNCTDHLSPGCS